MHRLIRGVKRRAVDLLNLDMVSEKYHVLAANYLFLMLYTTLESVFVNTLLYTVLDDISIVILYRAVVYISTAGMMHAAAYLGQKHNPATVIRLGAAFYMVMYLLLFFGMSYIKVLMIPIAFMSGVGAAFYWVGHNQLVGHYTTRHNRDIGIAILGIIQGVMTLFVPVVSGFVIRWMPGATGYRVMFGIGMVSVAAQVWVQRRLAPVEQKKHVSQAKLAFRMLRKKLSYRIMVAHEIVRGFREGAFLFLPNMMLFEIVTDESLVGINTFLTGAASIIGHWVYGKLVRPGMRGRAVSLAALILTAVTLPLYAVLNPVTVMVFSTISSFFTLFILNSSNATTFDVLGETAATRKCMGETIAIREGALCVGRIAGLVVLLLFPHNGRGYVNATLVLTIAQLLGGFLMMLNHRTLARKDPQEVNP